MKQRILVHAVLILGAAIVAAPRSACAQSTPKRFYPKDYANHVLDKGKPERGESEVNEHGPAAPKAQKPAALEVDTRRGMTEKKGIPVKAIGAIVSVAEEDHLKDQLDTLLKVVLDHDLPVSRVYFVGDIIAFWRSKTASAKIANALFILPILGVQFAPAKAIPPKYEAKQSPTWIVSTDEGEIVLEGILDLASYLNSAGEFIETPDSQGIAVDSVQEKKLADPVVKTGDHPS